MEDLTDIFMDIGPASRELAPLKLKRPDKLKSKTLVKVPRANDDNHLFNNHMFHHMLGLSNLNKGKDLLLTLSIVLRQKARELNLSDMSPDRDYDDSFVMETSYDHSINAGKSPSSKKR